MSVFGRSLLWLIAGVVVSTGAIAQGWSIRAPMPIARFQADTAVLGNKLYLFGGYATNSDSDCTAPLQAYDYIANAWSIRASLAVDPRMSAVVASGNLLYAFTGPNPCQPSNTTVTVFAYDPEANTWSGRMASAPMGDFAALSRAVEVAGRVYLARFDRVLVYDIASDAWSTLQGSPRTAAWSPSDPVAVVDGHVYAIHPAAGKVTIWNPLTHTWSSRDIPTTFSADDRGAHLNGRIYVVGSPVRVYDIATNSWGSTLPLLSHRGRFSTAVVGGQVLAIGGSGGPAAVPEVEASDGLLLVVPSILAFGSYPPGRTSHGDAVAIVNQGHVPVTVNSVSLCSAPWPWDCASASGEFTASNACTTLAAGASCLITVKFTPGGLGARSGSLGIATSQGDFTVALRGAGAKSLVSHYYRSILRRPPDAGGEAYWTAEAARVAELGASLNEVWFAMAMGFFFSPEYMSLGRNDTEFIRDLYRTFFDREPDTGGLGFWTAQLAAGMPREVVLVSFMFSPEFKSFTDSIFGPTAVRAEMDATVDFYRGILARLPDSEGFNHWKGRLRAGQCLDSATMSAIADAVTVGFSSSPEYGGRGRSNAQFVADMYNTFMRRGGELDGVRAWIAQLDSGASREMVRRHFVASAEFQARVHSIMAQGCIPATCDIAVSPAFRNVPAAAGTGSFDVVTTVGCPWTVQSNASWAQVTNVQGSTVTYVYTANPSTISRQALFNVAPGVQGALPKNFSTIQSGNISVLPPPPPPGPICPTAGYCRSNNVCCPRGMVGCDGRCYNSVTDAYRATGNTACLSALVLCPF